MNKHEEKRRAEKIAAMKRGEELMKIEEDRYHAERDQQIDGLTNIIAGLEVSVKIREQRLALRLAALRVDEIIHEDRALELEIAWNQARALNRIAAALERG